MVGDGKTYDDPSDVRAVDGKVEVDGPDSVDVTLSPEAAEETSERLIKEATRAAGQRRMRANAQRARR